VNRDITSRAVESSTDEQSLLMTDESERTKVQDMTLLRSGLRHDNIRGSGLAPLRQLIRDLHEAWRYSGPSAEPRLRDYPLQRPR
jgi:hypothetical protein